MEIESKYPIIIDEKTRTNISNLIKDIYQVNVNSSKLKKILISKQWKWLTIITGLIGSLFMLTAFIIIILQVMKTSETTSKKDFVLLTSLVIGSTLLMFAILLQVTTNKIKKRIRFFITQKILNYYQSVAENNIESLKINSFTKTFTIIPENFVPNPKINTKIFNENVINGSFLNHDFNLGTILEKIIEKDDDGKTTSTTYNRYLFLTILIPQYDYTTTIRPSSFFDKFTQRKEIKLESHEFEKMFTLDYSDPIKLRKLLPPKVMAKMLDFGILEKEDKKIPHIYLNQKQVTIMVPFNHISSPNSAKGNLLNFKVSDNINKTIDNLLFTIQHDLTQALTLIKWVQIMDLI